MKNTDSQQPVGEGSLVPEVDFVTREGDTQTCGNAFGAWKHVSSKQIFSGKRVVVFALPGAYTPTCSSTHLPGYDARFAEVKSFGVDAVCCLSVNDAFVMHQWALSLDVQNVQMLPDGNADFTRGMGMLVEKRNLGFGERSWRYSMVVTDGRIEKIFIEDGKEDNAEGDPFAVSGVETMLTYLQTAGR